MAELVSLDPGFTLGEWNRLIPQVELTLNLLRAVRLIPKLLVWTYVFGQVNSMVTQVVPPGIKVLVHDKPSHIPR